MRKTTFCFSPDFLERKLSLSSIGYSPAPAYVQSMTMTDGPSNPPPTLPPTGPSPTDPINPDPGPGDPGSPTDPY